MTTYYHHLHQQNQQMLPTITSSSPKNWNDKKDHRFGVSGINNVIGVWTSYTIAAITTISTPMISLIGRYCNIKLLSYIALMTVWYDILNSHSFHPPHFHAQSIMMI
jgi:hypothetical protein